MKIQPSLALGLLPFCLCTALHAAAYLKFQDVKAEAQDVTPAQWTEITSVDWRTQSGTAPENTKTGEVQELCLTVCSDNASPKLRQRCVLGTQYRELLLKTDSTENSPSTSHVLRDITITGYSIQKEGDQLTELVTLNYGEVQKISDISDDIPSRHRIQKSQSQSGDAMLQMVFQLF